MTEPDADIIEHASEPSTWQGKLTPDAEIVAQEQDNTAATGRPRLRSDARQLLGELISPHRRAIIEVLIIALVQVMATMAGPWLIGIAIDTSLPRATHGDYASLSVVSGGLP